MNDMVHHPEHYTSGDVECIDAIKASMTPEEFAGYLKGCIMKYMWRFEKKWAPKEDLEKARFYLDLLIEEADGVFAKIPAHIMDKGTDKGLVPPKREECQS